ncbi:undecaprenyl-phosphate glucose phosphotransferase [Pedobacter chinensis]|uniref:Undecaprenyl-phosphate glucose phosphotransferase n=1 Tax=Pedobacter chinensis TaxID=2282421 RepID=A0A369PSN1_9SPHI|nr:exopolysaccharide biosynthesis polyprenyl glycosylphosphotransferase [Pedobacter chinensis]RDC54285.1 undecaprenyl-phosphate glucose phosphotransferase [Pedobacter chinensis]
MKSRHVFIFITILTIFDALAINCSFAIIFFSGLLKDTNLGGAAQFLILINLTWMISAIVNGAYTFKNVQKLEVLYKKGAFTFILHIVLLTLIAYLFLPQLNITPPLIYVFSLELIAVSGIRFMTYVFERYYLKMDMFKKNIAIIGNHDLGTRLEKFFLTNRLTVNFRGSFKNLNEEVLIDEQPIHRLQTSIRYAIENHLDEVYTTEFPEQCVELDEVIALAEKHCVRVKFVTSFIKYKREEEDFKNSNYRLSSYYDGIPILVNRREPLTKLRNRIIKRGFDVLFSLAVIVFVLSWLFPLLVLLILIESRGNPIFMQLRSGRDNKPFYCFKFRSMRINADSNTQQAARNDPRVTKIGSFMRKTSLDELPQFFNVLLGEMSVVGPRPHMLKHTEEYSQIIDQYMVRQFLKPGITGQAQVNGFRGETKETEQMLGRVKHDISYMENWTLLQDFKIITKTITNVLGGEENAF